MRSGLQIDTYGAQGSANEWDRMLAVAKLGEELGFESVWFEDHFMFPDREHPEKEIPVMECLTTLAGLAACTSRVKLGSLMLGAPYRNPALLANMKKFMG